METSPPPVDRQALLALLAWTKTAGIDVFLTDAPRDRFAETKAEKERLGRRPSPAPTRRMGADEPSSAATPATRGETNRPGASAFARPAPDTAGAAQRTAVPDEAAIASARERALAATSLADLEAALADFDGCNLKATARRTVFGNGAEQARVMIVGEAPGREEDNVGVPFVGKSGQLLDRMLAAIGIERDSVRVTNAVPWRPPGNRAPTPTETAICLPFLRRHIELVRPDVLVCVGSPAAKTLLGSKEGILRIRGRWTSYDLSEKDGHRIDAIAMLHPAYLLRQPAQKRLAWRDLQTLSRRLVEGSRNED